MPKPSLKIGEQYGDMLCIAKAPSKRNHARFLVRCIKCGKEKEVYGSNLKAGEGQLHETSCKPDLLKIGSLYGDMLCKERMDDRNHMQRYKLECIVCKRSKEVYVESIQRGSGLLHKHCSYLIKDKGPYFIAFRERWQNMRNRTNVNVKNPKNACYHEKGIKSDAFANFVDFYDTLYTSFIDHVKQYGIEDTTLDRIDGSKDYSPENCRWATRLEQSQNRSNVSNEKCND